MEPIEWLLFIIPLGISGLLFLVNRAQIGRKDVLEMAKDLAKENREDRHILHQEIKEIHSRLAHLEGRQEERDSKNKGAV